LLKLISTVGLLGVWCIAFFGNGDEKTESLSALLIPPAGFPEIPFTEENQFTEARWLLGRKLFYEPLLSVDSSISCASCHMAQFAFSDTVAMSFGAGKALGTRNAPTLTNVAYNPYFTRDGGVPTLEMQILVPIQEHNEFNFNIVLISERLMKDSTYVQMSRAAYDREPDHFVITRAIGCFERTIISGNSRFDKYFYQKEKDVLSNAEMKGKELFYSEQVGCTNCHSGFNFADYTFKNNGLYEAYADSGRLRFSNLETDRAIFKVPTLRNVGLTAPYMHDGSFQTLTEVVEHYTTGGKAHKNKSEFIKPIDLNAQEKEQLVAFLHTLTDEEFINRKEFQPEAY
jgi:cytochrome c peroxidase